MDDGLGDGGRLSPWDLDRRGSGRDPVVVSFLVRCLRTVHRDAQQHPQGGLGPIFIVWLGTDVRAVLAMAIAISVIVTLLMVFTAFREVDPNKIKLLRTFGVTKRQILFKALIPQTVPTMIAALKVNVGLSLVGTIVGEFRASKAGLGYLIIYGGQVFNMSLVMAAVVLLALVSIALYYGVSYIESRVVRPR